MLTEDVFWQALFVFAIGGACYYLSKKIAPLIQHKPTKDFFKRKKFALKTFLFYLIFSAVLWLGVALFKAAGIPYAILQSVASLTTAWIGIKSVTLFFKTNYWVRLTALFIWVLAALNIMDVLVPTIDLLSDFSFSIGKYELSVLTILKGIFVFALLLFGSNYLLERLSNHFKEHQDLPKAQRILVMKTLQVLVSIFVVFLGLNLLGIDLTTLAFLSGAIGLGVGFGLQKIFSNLVSGFILLFDKSIKPGDVIAINGTYGEVKKLMSRYVSVVTRDGKKHLIPNDFLITERVENWSYQDDRLRLHIPIGVSYKSDIPKARKLIIEAAKKTDRILKDPEPVCLIRGFGDSSVDLELRAWIIDPVNGIETIKSDVYEKVWDKFKENGIEIPYPQRDVHIKSEK